jgi:hypothetical protein
MTEILEARNLGIVFSFLFRLLGGLCDTWKKYSDRSNTAAVLNSVETLYSVLRVSFAAGGGEFVGNDDSR